MKNHWFKLLSALVLVLFSFTVHADEAAPPAEEDLLSRYYSPWIEGDVLYIKGYLDSHVYDFISYEAVALKKVRVVELNSFGGNARWSMDVANKLKALNITTRLKKGSVCASACTYLFSAGVTREAEAGTWFGVHGARLGAGYTTTFMGVCFVDLDDDSSQFMPNKKGCQDFLKNWYVVAMQMTNDAFDLMESNGVSPEMRKTYFEMPDDPAWPGEMNVIRKPNWTLTAEEAVKFNFVTDLK